MRKHVFIIGLSAGLALALPPVGARAQQSDATQPAQAIAETLAAASSLAQLKAVVVARDGKIVAERGYGGHTPIESANIKSASKSIISALVGIAIDKGLLEGVDQPIAPILASDLPVERDPRLDRITIGNLLSMQAGLERTSGGNYGRWVGSRNWVRAALAMPFADEPGGTMLYSTGSTHLLSAILTKVGGKSTLALARDWLGPLEEFRIGAWDRDPQGIYLGGNQMAMSTRSLLAFGELYRNRGRTADGTQVVPEDWVRQSWQSRTNSRFSNDGYGYGWFERVIGGKTVHYAWGFGGQMLYIVPELGLTVAMTSDEGDPSARSGYRDDLHDLLAKIIGTAES